MTEELKRELRRSENLLCKGLKEINEKGVMSDQALDRLDKMADIALDMCKIDKESGESYGRFYDDGYGRRMRDSNGRFTEGHGDGDNNYSAGEANGYNRDGYNRDGYSRDGYGRDSYGEEREYLDWNLRKAQAEMQNR